MVELTQEHLELMQRSLAHYQRNYPSLVDEMESEALVWIAQAARRFDPTKNYLGDHGFRSWIWISARRAAHKVILEHNPHYYSCPKHLKAVLDQLRPGQPMRPDQLAAATGNAIANIDRVLRYLVSQGIVRCQPAYPGRKVPCIYTLAKED